MSALRALDEGVHTEQEDGAPRDEQDRYLVRRKRCRRLAVRRDVDDAGYRIYYERQREHAGPETTRSGLGWDG